MTSTTVTRHLSIDAFRRVVGVAIVAALIFLPYLTSSPYLLSLGSIVAVDAALALSVIVLMGFAGELSFAYGVLFGVGAYIAWEISRHSSQQWLAIIGGSAGAIIVGVCVAIPAVRVRGLQLALATFAMGLAGSDIFGRLSGYSGTVDVRTFTLFGHQMQTPASQVTFWGVVAALLYACVALVLRGRVGRRFLLLKEDEPTARSLGINTTKERTTAFAISAFVLGLVGTIYPGMLGLLDPSNFSFQEVVTLLIVVFVGGISWPEGALVGAVAIVAVGQAVGSTPGLESVIYGAGLLVVLAVAPTGLLGLPALLGRLAGFGSAKPSDTPPTTRGDRVPPVAAVPSPPPQERPRPAGARVVLEAQGLTKSFGNVHAVAGVELKVTAGRVLAIAGANGAGKSTLLDLLTGFQHADNGSVKYIPDGREPVDLTRMRSDQIARLGLVRTFQFPGIVAALNVGENVRLSAEAAGLRGRRAVKMARESLQAVGMLDDFFRSGSNLPHGTRKLLDLARVICQRPAVALFDEPSSGLGGAELPWLAEGLNALAAAGSAVVVIEHNMEFIGGSADEMVVLDFGRVIATGRPKEVLGSDAVRAAYLGTMPPVASNEGIVIDA